MERPATSAPDALTSSGRGLAPGVERNKRFTNKDGCRMSGAEGPCSNETPFNCYSDQALGAEQLLRFTKWRNGARSASEEKHMSPQNVGSQGCLPHAENRRVTK